MRSGVTQPDGAALTVHSLAESKSMLTRSPSAAGARGPYATLTAKVEVVSG